MGFSTRKPNCTYQALAFDHSMRHRLENFFLGGGVSDNMQGIYHLLSNPTLPCLPNLLLFQLSHLPLGRSQQPMQIQKRFRHVRHLPIGSSPRPISGPSLSTRIQQKKQSLHSRHICRAGSSAWFLAKRPCWKIPFVKRAGLIV